MLARVFAAALITAWLEGSAYSKIWMSSFMLMLEMYLWKFYEQLKLDRQSIL